MMETLVVGGGLAGAAAAIHLARAGREVTLVERETTAHDKVCGEFLSGEAVGYLAALGIDLPLLGAEPIADVRFADGSRVARRALPFAAYSLSRRILDEALLARAAEAGATVLRGQTVQGLERSGQGWRARLSSSPAGGEGVFCLTANSVFLASGKHDVRGWKRSPGKQNDLIGFKMHWTLTAPQARDLSGHVELFLFPGGYGGIEPVEGGQANFCFLIRRAQLEAEGGRWEAVLSRIARSCPHIAARLEGAAASWEKPLAITAIPYGYVRRDSSDGLWRLGDQAAVIPSFSGDGMSIALHSARLAARTYLGDGTASAYQCRLAGDVAHQVHLATAISRALVTPGGQRLCGLAAGLMPWAMSTAAKATRIPERALAA